MPVDIAPALEFQAQGKLEEAEKIYLEFLKENPKQPDVSNLLGSVYLHQQKFEQALKYYQYAIEGFPCAEYYQNYGLAFYAQKKYPQAMECFSKAIAYEPQNIEFIRNLAKLASKSKQTDNAIDFYIKCLALDPKDYVGWNNLGLQYKRKHDLVMEKECYKKSLKIKDNYEAWHNLGVIYRMERNMPESIKCFKQALKLKPTSEITKLSIGMSYLSQKDFKTGYQYYMTKKPEVKAQYKNHWDGKEHKDKTLLVYYDAGFGDQLMFCRYLNLAKEKFAHVKFYCSHQLRTLFEKNFPDIEIAYTKDVPYDYSDNIMYLNYHLGLDFENIPFSKGYLTAEKTNDERFDVSEKKIGLFWQGSYDGYDNRAIPLKELELLLKLENSKFYGFVKEDKFEQIKEFPQIVDIGSTLGDFYDTATKLLALDVFVTVDTAAANLAGALGVKTFLLLPYASEWRWFNETKTTQWYDSVTIFKQRGAWDWRNVVQEVYTELKK